jgi:hypothetical protein
VSPSRCKRGRRGTRLDKRRWDHGRVPAQGPLDGGRTFRGLALIGNGEIDLRQARFIDGETTVHATAIIGSVIVVVPEDAEGSYKLKRDRRRLERKQRQLERKQSRDPERPGQMASGAPGGELAGGAGVEDAVRGDAVALGPDAAVFEPVELAGRYGIPSRRPGGGAGPAGPGVPGGS